MDEFKAAKIIDNLLIAVVAQKFGHGFITGTRKHLTEIQDEFIKEFPTWFKPALEFLYYNGGTKITLANTEWAERVMSAKTAKGWG